MMHQENLNKRPKSARAAQTGMAGKAAGWLLAGLAGLAMGCAADRDYIRHHLSEVPPQSPALASTAAPGQL